MSSAEHEFEGPDQGLKRTLKDLFAGAVGGVAQVLLGMFFPFVNPSFYPRMPVGRTLGIRDWIFLKAMICFYPTNGASPI